MTSLLPFIATTFLLAMLPGVGQALMSRQVLTNGRGAALATTAGTGTGLMLWSVAAAAGLSALVLEHPAALTGLRCAGGIVLIVLGLRTFLRRARTRTAESPRTRAPLEQARLGSFLVGLATNLANPKAGIFAVALLPQFIPAGASPFWATAGLGLVWALVTVTWYGIFTWLVARGRQLLASPRSQRLLDLASGGALVAVGVAVASGL